jgi:hypothetical protein
MLPDLIRSLTEPLTLTAGCLLVLGLFVFFLSRNKQTSKKLDRLALLGSLFGLIVGSFSAYHSAQQMKSEREYERLHAVFNVHAVIKGTITGTKKTTLTFQTSSGYVSVGCDDTQTARAIWAVPQGATEISPKAEWHSTSNIQSQTQSVEPFGEQVIAIGTISGLHRNFLGNCEGGGHGELVLYGTYTMSEKEPHEQQTLKTLDDRVNRGQPFVVAIPQGPDITPESCDITVVGDNHKEDILNITLQVKETQQASATTPDFRYTVRLEQNTLTLIID